MTITFVGQSAGEQGSSEFVFLYPATPEDEEKEAFRLFLALFSQNALTLPEIQPLQESREITASFLLAHRPKYACRWEGIIGPDGTITSLSLHQREEFPIISPEEIIERVARHAFFLHGRFLPSNSIFLLLERWK